MDYIYINTEGRYEDYAWAFFEIPNSFGEQKTVTLENNKHLKGFINELSKEGVPKPIGRIYIVAHANRKGQIKINIDDNKNSSKGWLFYPDILKAIADNSVAIPKSFVHTTGNSAPSPQLIEFVSCNVGNNKLFVDKLREAFSSKVKVKLIFPLHFVNIIDKAHGVFIFYRYDFFTLSKDYIKEQTVLVNKFSDEKLFFHDGRLVEKTFLSDLIPHEKKWPFDIGDKNGELVFNSSIHTMTENIGIKSQVSSNCRISFDRLTRTILIKEQVIPVNEKLKLDLIKKYFETNFHKDFPKDYPEHRARLFNSLEHFINSLTWTFTQKAGDLEVRGVYFEYRLSMPVTNLMTDKRLFFKYRSRTRDGTFSNIIDDEARQGLFYISEDGE